MTHEIIHELADALYAPLPLGTGALFGNISFVDRTRRRMEFLLGGTSLPTDSSSSSSSSPESDTKCAQAMCVASHGAKTVYTVAYVVGSHRHRTFFETIARHGDVRVRRDWDRRLKLPIRTLEELQPLIAGVRADPAIATHCGVRASGMRAARQAQLIRTLRGALSEQERHALPDRFEMELVHVSSNECCSDTYRFTLLHPATVFVWMPTDRHTRPDMNTPPTIDMYAAASTQKVTQHTDTKEAAAAADSGPRADAGGEEDHKSRRVCVGDDTVATIRALQSVFAHSGCIDLRIDRSTHPQLAAAVECVTRVCDDAYNKTRGDTLGCESKRTAGALPSAADLAHNTTAYIARESVRATCFRMMHILGHIVSGETGERKDGCATMDDTTSSLELQHPCTLVPYRVRVHAARKHSPLPQQPRVSAEVGESVATVAATVAEEE